MTDILKGNFQPRNKVVVDAGEKSIEQQFEEEALRHVGGSMTFVSKQKVMWDSKGSIDETSHEK